MNSNRIAKSVYLLLTMCALGNNSFLSVARAEVKYAVTDLSWFTSSDSLIAINYYGQIVGNTFDTTQHAWLWTPTTPNATIGTQVSLGTNGGPYSFAKAINDSGQVTGDGVNAAGNDDAFLWTPTTPNGTIIELILPVGRARQCGSFFCAQVLYRASASALRSASVGKSGVESAWAPNSSFSRLLHTVKS